MAALQYADVPGYAALLLRRSYPELAMAGALMDVAWQWLGPTPARFNSTTKTWRFPSGASVRFGYLRHEEDKRQYQSAEFQFIGFDELTTFTETQYRFMFSRLRRPKRTTRGSSPDGVSLSTVPLRMRSASNPGGPGHTWVNTRLVDPATRVPGSVFMPARIVENPSLDIDEYLKALSHLTPAEQLRLINGDWLATEAGDLFQKWWFQLAPSLPDHLTARSANVTKVRYWDFAATEPTPSNPDPDYTAGTRIVLDRDTGHAYVTDVRHERLSSGKVERLVRQTAEEDGRDTQIIIEVEPGSAGKGQLSHYTRNVLRGFITHGEHPTGPKDVRARPLASAAEHEQVTLIKGPWVNEFLDELGGWPNTNHDDIMDSAGGAYRWAHRLTGRATIAVPQGRIPTRGAR